MSLYRKFLGAGRNPNTIRSEATMKLRVAAMPNIIRKTHNSLFTAALLSMIREGISHLDIHAWPELIAPEHAAGRRVARGF